MQEIFQPKELQENVLLKKWDIFCGFMRSAIILRKQEILREVENIKNEPISDQEKVAKILVFKEEMTDIALSYRQVNFWDSLVQKKNGAQRDMYMEALLKGEGEKIKKIYLQEGIAPFSEGNFIQKWRTENSAILYSKKPETPVSKQENPIMPKDAVPKNPPVPTPSQIQLKKEEPPLRPSIRSSLPPAPVAQKSIPLAKENSAKIDPFDAIRNLPLPVKKEKETEKEYFYKCAFFYAQEIEKRCGIPHEVVFGQACIESENGQNLYTQKYNNYFGIKARKGEEKYTISTQEYIRGRAQTVSADFRSYTSMAESFSDYARFLTQSPNYRAAFQFAKPISGSKNPEWFPKDYSREDADVEKFLQEIAKKYCTDPRYVKKVMSCFPEEKKIPS